MPAKYWFAEGLILMAALGSIFGLLAGLSPHGKYMRLARSVLLISSACLSIAILIGIFA